jgi:hypothetical protein
MQFFFESFTNKTEIKSTTICFNFFELNEIYKNSTKDIITAFMTDMISQIVKYKLLLDIDDFVIDCYTITDKGLFYNPYFFDRFQEPEYNQTHTQFYGSME